LKIKNNNTTVKLPLLRNLDIKTQGVVLRLPYFDPTQLVSI